MILKIAGLLIVFSVSLAASEAFFEYLDSKNK